MPTSEQFQQVSPTSNVSLTQFDWSQGVNWTTDPNNGSGAQHVVPQSTTAAFIVGANGYTMTAYVTQPGETAANVYVGQGPGSGAVYMFNGSSMSIANLFLGQDVPAGSPNAVNSGLWYQSGGTLTTNSGVVQLGTAINTNGELVLKGGTIAAGTTNVGAAGYGAMTVAGGTYSTVGLNIAAIYNAGTGKSNDTSSTALPAGDSEAGSYVSVAAGTLAVTSTLNVGAPDAGSGTGIHPGLLSLAGGTTQWGGNLNVQGTGSEVVVTNAAGTLGSWTGTSSTAMTLGAHTALEFDLTPTTSPGTGASAGSAEVNLQSGQLVQDPTATLVVDGSQLNYTGNAPRTYRLLNYGSLSGSTRFGDGTGLVTLKGFANLSAQVHQDANGIWVVVSRNTQPPTTTTPLTPSLSALSSPTQAQAQSALTSTAVDPNHALDYQYDPSFMYDETEGLYKVWTTYHVQTPTVLSGTVIGTAGSWGNNPNTTRAAAFDDDETSYFDGPDASGDYVGQDLGTATQIMAVRYAPRVGFEGRMTGGVFQGSNDQSNWTTFATVSQQPADGLTTLTLPSPSVAYRYVRYLSPANGECNLSELEFLGPGPGESATTTATAGNTTPEGDNIGYAAAPTTAFLKYAPLRDSLSPSSNTTSYFDRWDVADPSVYRDPNTGTWYMAYTGYPLPSPAGNPPTGVPDEIGLAVSYDDGRTFSPVYSSSQYTSPGYSDASHPRVTDAGTVVSGYLDLSLITNTAFPASQGTQGTRQYADGTGYLEPSVAYDAADNLWYMSFTDDPYYNGLTANYPTQDPNYAHNPQRVDVIVANNPQFQNATPVLYLDQTAYLSQGPDLAYSSATGQLIFASDESANTVPYQGTSGSYPQGDVPVALVTYTPGKSTLSPNPTTGSSTSTNLPELSVDVPGLSGDFLYGQGIGMLKTAEGATVAPGYFAFAAGTSSLNGPTRLVSVVAPVQQLVGTTVGTSGSWNNQGNTIAKATDGDLTTFFDGPDASGDWLAIDLSAARTVSEIKIAPRSGAASRMVGGYFQAANSLTDTPVTIATITSTPTDGQLTTIVLSSPVTYRYFSYVGPNGGYCNIAEFQLFGY